MYRKVERIVSGQLGVPVEIIRSGVSENGNRTISDARHFVWYILHGVLGYRTSAIAEEYRTSQRNIFLANAIIREGIRTQPYFAKHYRAMQAEMREEEII